jgi:hypothetical protein
MLPTRVSAALVLAATVAAAERPAAAGTLEPPFDLYEAGPAAAEGLAAAAANVGPWKVLQRETKDRRTWLLLALPDGLAGGELSGLGRPRYLGRVRPGEQIIFAAPSDRRGDRLRTGRSVTIAPSGATVLVTTEPTDELARRAHAGFHVLDRDVPLTPPRPPGPPAGIRPLLEHALALETPGWELRAAVADSSVAFLRDQVDSANLLRYVDGLSLDGGIASSSRWWADPRTEGVKADSIVIWLGAALGLENVRKHRFELEGRSVHNIIAKHASPNPDAGAILVTAHYDATGKLSSAVKLCDEVPRPPGCNCLADPTVIDTLTACQWNEDTDPAPGADDNASGVAAMIETARVLADVTFDFDIYYVAFQAEEKGLIGSAAFADSIASDTIDQDVFAVLNMDMLGYRNAPGEHVDIVANETSEWFADWIVETATRFVPVSAEKIVTIFGRSDHASFWRVGIDGVLMIENIDLPYPEYHTFQDLWNNDWPAGEELSELQLRYATQLAVTTLGRFAVHYEDPDLAIPAGELVARPVSSIDFEAGRDILLQARVHNFGTSHLTFQKTTVESLTARVQFFDGDPAGNRLIAEETRTQFFASGGVVVFEGIWETRPGQEGFHEIHAVVEGLDPGYAQREEFTSTTNNRSSVEFFLQSPRDAGPRLLELYAYPNPVIGDISNLTFYYELTDVAGVSIDVFDLEGNWVGAFGAEANQNQEGSRPGANRITGDLIRDDNKDPITLKSGVFVYTVRVFDRDSGAVTDTRKGKFAIVQ